MTDGRVKEFDDKNGQCELLESVKVTPHSWMGSSEHQMILEGSMFRTQKTKCCFM